MARIEDLIDEIPDPSLRDEIARQVKLLKSTKRFGLVYEDHVPETVALPGLPVQVGSIVANRKKPDDALRLQVVSVDDGKATIAPVGLDEPREVVDVDDLMVVKAFEEPIFPGLTQVGEVRRGPADKPAHTVISGENFHALQLLAYTHAGKIDVIYIDPPYNTGARDWKYNNRFVDSNDAYRHSKWLAMMEKRLRLSRKLLKPDGVLIVTIDEKEYLHLGILLDQTFPEAIQTMVSSVINPKGTGRSGDFARTNEFLYFVRLGRASVAAVPDHTSLGKEVAWETMRRRNLASRRGRKGKGACGPNQFYPIFVEEKSGYIVGRGDPLAVETSRTTVVAPPGAIAVFPVRSDGTEMNWEYTHTTFDEWWSRGFVRANGAREEMQPYIIQHLPNKARSEIADGIAVVEDRRDDGSVVARYVDASSKTATTQWNYTSHSAEHGGTGVLKAFMPDRRFDYPKSMYAVADAVNLFVGSNPHAVLLDFFAGSGTTLHAVAMLNAQDGGSRQCIMVTNNDVSEAEAKRLNKDGHFPGDTEYEAEGIFQSVTKPRVEAALTGVRPDGEPVQGTYLDQYLPDHSYADGFEENVAFFRMDYLEPDLVELGRQYDVIAPLLWMSAGSVGNWETWDGKAPWSAPASSTYAVLFDLTEASAFASMVESRREISHVWIVTDSHSAFVETREELPGGVEAAQLYRDYLKNFTVNAPGVLD